MIIISIAGEIILIEIETLIFAIVENVIYCEADFNFIMNERDKAVASIGFKVTLSFIRSSFLMLILGLKFGY